MNSTPDVLSTCYLTNNVTALMEHEALIPTSALIFSSSITGLITEGALLLLRQLSDANTNFVSFLQFSN